MHSLSNELLGMKIIYLGNSAIMDNKRKKLQKCNRAELVIIDTEVRAELNQPKITDVLSGSTETENVQIFTISKAEIVEDILAVITNSVKSNLKTIFSHE